MSRQAVILAGGKGTRLRPYTISVPKPLVPIGDRAILDIVLSQLSRGGFSHVVLAVNHLAHIVRAFSGDGERWGMKIAYAEEEMPLGTMGPVKLIADRLPEHFLVMNGDVLTDLDFATFHDRHAAADRNFTIAASHRMHRVEYGVLEARDTILTGFREKPETRYDVSMGIYMLSRRVLHHIPAGRPFGFDDLMRVLLTNNQQVHLDWHPGYWKDIGVPEDYQQATLDYESGRFTCG